MIVLGLWLGFERTRIGAQIRAAVDNRRMAELLGINVDRLFTITFAFGSGMAALGGGLGAEFLGLDPQYALKYLVYFLIVVAVGGLGQDHRRVLCVAHHRRARFRARSNTCRRAARCSSTRSPSCCCCGGRRACSDGTA